jgi:Flp pilus assembly protein TadD
MYLPVLAFAAGVAAGRQTTKTDRLCYSFSVVIALTVVSIIRTQVWASDESLWRQAVSRAPDKVRPKIQLARAVPAPQALQILAAARAQAPDDPNVATETGRILLSEGQAAAALSEFGRALALNPRDAANYNNRGAALAALGQTEAARQDFQRALRLDPALTSASRNLQALPAQ